MVAAALMGGSALRASARELDFIMCGAARPADQTVIDKFMAANKGVSINMQIVPWGTCQHKAEINQLVVPVPHCPSGASGTILITDSIAIFKQKDPAVEAMAQKLAQALTSGEAQYELDKSWGLTPIFQYDKLGVVVPLYVNDPLWKIFVDGIATGGPESMLTNFKSLQGVFTTMIQGIMLVEGGSVDDLVKQAGVELADVK